MKTKMKTAFAIIAVAVMVMAAFMPMIGFSMPASGASDNAINADVPEVTISGTVYEADARTPIEGATVKVDVGGIESVETDANGKFYITIPATENAVTVSVTLEDHSFGSQTLKKVTSDVSGLVFVDSTVTVTGWLVDKKGAQLYIGGQSINAGTYSATTEPDGTFSFNAKLGDRLTITCSSIVSFSAGEIVVTSSTKDVKLSPDNSDPDNPQPDILGVKLKTPHEAVNDIDVKEYGGYEIPAFGTYKGVKGDSEFYSYTTVTEKEEGDYPATVIVVEYISSFCMKNEEITAFPAIKIPKAETKVISATGSPTVGTVKVGDIQYAEDDLDVTFILSYDIYDAEGKKIDDDTYNGEAIVIDGKYYYGTNAVPGYDTNDYRNIKFVSATATSTNYKFETIKSGNVIKSVNEVKVTGTLLPAGTPFTVDGTSVVGSRESGANGSIVLYVPIGTALTVTVGEKYSPQEAKYAAIYTPTVLPEFIPVFNGIKFYGIVTANDMPVPLTDSGDVYGSLEVYVNGLKKNVNVSWEVEELPDLGFKAPYYAFELDDLFGTETVSVKAIGAENGFYFDESAVGTATYDVKEEYGIVSPIAVTKGMAYIDVYAYLASTAKEGQTLALKGVDVTFSIYKYDALSGGNLMHTPEGIIGTAKSVDGVAAIETAVLPQKYLATHSYVYVAEAYETVSTEYGTMNFSKTAIAYTPDFAAAKSVDDVEYNTVYPNENGEISAGIIMFNDTIANEEGKVVSAPAGAITPWETVFSGYYAENGQALPGFNANYVAYKTRVGAESKDIVQTGNVSVIGAKYYITLCLDLVGGKDGLKTLAFDLYTNILQFHTEKGAKAEGLGLGNMNCAFVASPQISNDPFLTLGSATITLAMATGAGTEEAFEDLTALPLMISDYLQAFSTTFYSVTVDGLPILSSTDIPAGEKVVITPMKSKIAIPLADLALTLKIGDQATIILDLATKYADLAMYLQMDSIVAINEKGETVDLTKGGVFEMTGNTRVLVGMTVGYEQAGAPPSEGGSNGIDPTVLTVGIIAVVIALIAVAFVAFMSTRKE